ncbi:MAG: hypothetical protein BroJett040_17990 [Oligoflexia bacterium]|nr:MAG: hypothetical protein BroJett040_17990 [Oligoflexia bacterium]
MIKINLIKTAKIAAGPDASLDAFTSFDDTAVQKQGAIRLGLFMLGPILLFMLEGQIIPEKNAVLAKKQKVYNELVAKNQRAKTAVDEIKKFKEDQAKLQEQISTIEGLRKDRMREVKVLDVVQRDIPEKMWLLKMELRDGKLAIQGIAATDYELTTFMDSLSKSAYIKEVNLVRATEKAVEGQILKEFSISCVMEKQEKKVGGGI